MSIGLVARSMCTLMVGITVPAVIGCGSNSDDSGDADRISGLAPLSRESGIVSNEDAERFARDWIAAWNSHDLDRILAHYADDFEMASPRIVAVTGEASGVLHGRSRVGAYWAMALEMNSGLRFELIEAFAGVDRIGLLYRRQDGTDAMEIFELGSDGKVQRSAALYPGARP